MPSDYAPHQVEALANEFLSKPIRVNVGSFDLTANKRVTQTVEVIDESNKPKRLKELLQKSVCLRLSGSGLRLDCV